MTNLKWIGFAIGLATPFTAYAQDLTTPSPAAPPSVETPAMKVEDKKENVVERLKITCHSDSKYSYTMKDGVTHESVRVGKTSEALRQTIKQGDTEYRQVSYVGYRDGKAVNHGHSKVKTKTIREGDIEKVTSTVQQVMQSKDPDAIYADSDGKSVAVLESTFTTDEVYKIDGNKKTKIKYVVEKNGEKEENSLASYTVEFKISDSKSILYMSSEPGTFTEKDGTVVNITRDEMICEQEKLKD